MPSLRGFAKFTPYLPLLALAIALLLEWVAPAHAQGPLVTPTPYPAIQATRTAAQAQIDAANQQQAQAAQLDAQAAEMRRNADAQQAQAQQAINDTRAAAAAQNASAVGEAIGRAESVLNQLRDTVAGQAAIIATATSTERFQAQTIISLTNENQALRVDKQVVAAAYTATVKRADEAQANAAPSPLVWLVVIGFMGLLAVLLIVVLGRKSGAAQVVYSGASPLDYGGEGEVVGENVVDN